MPCADRRHQEGVRRLALRQARAPRPRPTPSRDLPDPGSPSASFRRLSLFAARGVTVPGPPRIPRGARLERGRIVATCATEGASAAWTADSDRGVAGDEVRLDVRAQWGDPMPADDAQLDHEPFEPPDARILWFRAHRLGFRASLDVPCATGARLLSLGHCVVARRCPGATWLCCVRIRSVGARHRSHRGSRDRRSWPAWCTSRRRRSCASLLAGPSRIASWADGRQRSQS
jgi:hypothetical protein